jgi:hypothetical protein
MISNNKFLVAAGAAALTAGIYSSAASAATVTANAAANVITPLAISETNGINFGDVSVGTTGGTVVLDTAGNRTVTGDAEAVAGGTVLSGTYSVTGEGTKAYSIAFPLTATISSGGNNMTVNGFNHDAGANPALTGGSDTFNVGATLNIGASQPAGTYTGTYTLTVDYQ